MKILIFGIPRSGTTSLFNFLSESLPKNYKAYYEPYHIKFITDIDCDDCIVKTVLCDRLLMINGENLLEHSNRIIKDFDKIIYIKRKNINDTIKSMAYFPHSDLMKKNSFIVAQRNIKEWTKIFDIITNDKKVFYYEDIYQNTPSDEIFKMCNYLNINFNEELFNKIIHTSNRNFYETKTKTLI